MNGHGDDALIGVSVVTDSQYPLRILRHATAPMHMKHYLLALFLAFVAAPQLALGWWNTDWSQRRSFVIDPSAAGADYKEPISGFALPLRLHTGNFSFGEAKDDGSDLRVIGADDKTPLKYHVERFDPINELAIVWVHLPALPSGAKKETIWLYWGNTKAPAASPQPGAYDAATLVAYHFGEASGAPKDTSAYAHHASNAQGTNATADGPLGTALRFDGNARVTLDPAPGLKVAAGGGVTFSAWVRVAAEQTAPMVALGDAKTNVTIALDGLTPVVRVRVDGKDTNVKGGALAVARWHHLVVTIADRALIFVDGNEVASGAAKLPGLSGAMDIGRVADGGTGFTGDLDELHIASAARSASWVHATWASQSQDSKLIVAGQQEGAGGGASYLGILLDAVTIDGWIVIAILMVMLLVSFAIMIAKTLFVNRTERANGEFLDRFQTLRDDLAVLYRDEDARGAQGGTARFETSPLYRLYAVGIRELRHRFELYRAKGSAETLSPQAISAIRASLDAGLARETQRLNSQMVLLTIAISGGPFLGLLGTVVGVMITFAAIAAAGDVNVNSIAPGIAAALVATVAGLAVAIPALFGYNYLASRIRNITTDMQVFADELITKLAERHSV